MRRLLRDTFSRKSILASTVLVGLSILACGEDVGGVGDATPTSSLAPPTVLATIETSVDGISDDELGFRIEYPRNWSGEDTVSTDLIKYSEQEDWVVHTFVRASDPSIGFIGESLTLFLRVVTSPTESGRAAVVDYFESVLPLPSESAVVHYDVAGNSERSMRKLAEMSISGQRAVLIESTTPPGFVGEPHNVRGYFVERDGSLYVIAFLGPSLQDLRDSQNTIDNIIQSFEFIKEPLDD